MSPAPTEKVETAGAGPSVVLPIMVTPQRPQAVQVVIVGAGGTGARVLSPLIKMLRRGDRLDIVDHDAVEARNLLRQHFLSRHIGQNKAEVAAGRLRGEAARVGVTLVAWPAKAVKESLAGILEEGRGFQGRIILGCVDNREARKVMGDALRTKSQSAWIDAGNETAGGQVCLTTHAWPCWKIEQGGKVFMEVDRTVLRADMRAEGWFTVETLPKVFPALMDPKVKTPEEVAAEACAVRMDTQTVAANQMAAALMINQLGWLLDEVPFCNPGAYFHTLCTMKPIPFTGAVALGSNQWSLGVQG